jgi:hypothetical protein
MAKPHTAVKADGKIIGWVSMRPNGMPDLFLESIIRHQYAHEQAMEAQWEAIRANPDLQIGVLDPLWDISDRD